MLDEKDFIRRDGRCAVDSSFSFVRWIKLINALLWGQLIGITEDKQPPGGVPMKTESGLASKSILTTSSDAPTLQATATGVQP